MPKIEYVPKNFSTDRLQMIEKVNGVVAEYQKQGYSLTLRQVYYQMVARDIIPNNMRSYKNLGNLINDARLAGLIDWLAIEDRTRNLRGNSHWTEPGKVIESAAYSYHRDHWEGQPNYVEVWVEKDALNMDQVELYNPPPNPAKLSDSRASGYIEEYGDECWELDALEPKVISDLISKNVKKYRDDALYNAVVEREAEERRQLDDLAEHYEAVAENWEEIKERYVYGD